MEVKPANELNLNPERLFFIGIDLLHMNFRTLKLPTAFVTVINLHIEILGLVMRIFFGHPDTKIRGDISGCILTAKGAADKILWIHVYSF